MARERAVVQAFTGDGPILVAIHDVLADLYDLFDTRLPSGEGPVPVAEPAPARPGRKAVPVSEPAPDDPPVVEDDDPDEGDVTDRPVPPPLAGRGSSQTAWATWAVDAGVPVADGTSRDDIITACRMAGVIPEQ